MTLANATDYSLTAALWTRDVNRALEVGPRLRAGDFTLFNTIPLTRINNHSSLIGLVSVNGSTFHRESGVENAGLGYASIVVPEENCVLTAKIAVVQQATVVSMLRTSRTGGQLSYTPQMPSIRL